MKVLITEKLSEHRYKTPEGYLVCVDAILARTGKQMYKHSQVYDGSTDEITDVEVDRKPEQVFSPQAIASFENKPLTIQHPNEPVTIQNHKALYHGFARDIRRAIKRNGKILSGSSISNNLQPGDQEVLVGNIIVTTSDAIEEINNGLEFLSCGYDCDITQTDKPEQINIRGNHIALCDNPRAGITMLQDNITSPTKHIVQVLTDALDATHNFVIDEQFVYVTPEYPLDSMTWLKYFAKELQLNVGIKIKSKYYDDKVYIIGRKSDVEKLVAEYNALYRNRKLVATTSTEINSKRVYNKGYSLGDDSITDNITRTLFNGKQIVCKSAYVKNLKKGQQIFDYVSNSGVLLTIKDIKKREVNGTMYYTIQTNTTHNGKQIEIVRTPVNEVLVFVKQVNDEIEGGLADKMSIEDIAKKHNVSVDVIVEQLIKGIDVEYEHTKDKNKATEIAKDHLVEMPDYYDKLEEMEKEVTDSNDSNNIQIPRSSREFETVIREYHKKYGKILQVETMVYNFETGKYYMYNESTDYSFTSKRFTDSIEDADNVVEWKTYEELGKKLRQLGFTDIRVHQIMEALQDGKPVKNVGNLKFKRIKDSIEDAINYVVMCEQLYNGNVVKSRAPWIAFKSEDKSKAEQFVEENNAKSKSLVGFSQHYYIK